MASLGSTDDHSSWGGFTREQKVALSNLYTTGKNQVDLRLHVQFLRWCEIDGILVSIERRQFEKDLLIHSAKLKKIKDKLPNLFSESQTESILKKFQIWLNKRWSAKKAKKVRKFDKLKEEKMKIQDPYLIEEMAGDFFTTIVDIIPKREGAPPKIRRKGKLIIEKVIPDSLGQYKDEHIHKIWMGDLRKNEFFEDVKNVKTEEEEKSLCAGADFYLLGLGDPPHPTLLGYHLCPNYFFNSPPPPPEPPPPHTHKHPTPLPLLFVLAPFLNTFFSPPN